MSELRLNTDGHIIKFGADNDVSLTHVADTGLLLNSTMQLQFNDASQNINAPSATVLDINATDEIELNATLVDINANVEISGTATTTGVHTFSAAPVFPDGSIAVADLDIDGATDIGAAIVDADLFIVDDGAGGTNRKVTASRLKTYAGASGDITEIDSILKADLKIGEDDQTKIDFETADEIHFYANNVEQVYLADNIFGPQSDSDVDLGTTGVRWKDAYIDTITTTGASLFPTLGVITAKDLGAGIHIRKADSGASVLADAQELVIESDADTGLSILQHTGGNGTIAFGDSGDNNIGMIQYFHGSVNALSFTTNAAERARIASDGEFFIGSSTSTNSKLMVTQAENKALARFHNTDSSAGATLFKIKCDNSTGGDYTSFNIDRAGNSALNIAGTGNVTNTNNSYGAISDERIK
ncbi:hypothetical protein N9U06_01875, partial [Gammaproteobacteria bacterium]|nr:hypothetical protein [Gammaproteobacteria bacterium]